MRLIGIGLVSLLALGACGDPGDESSSSLPPATESTTSEPARSGPDSDLVEVSAVYERVEYYGACGNETLTVGGVMYYPFFLNDSPDFEVDRYQLVGALLGVLGQTAGSVTAVPMVAPPGPGDDIGDLIVYADGIARFESDSGWVIWLTEEEQTYGWEC